MISSKPRRALWVGILSLMLVASTTIPGSTSSPRIFSTEERSVTTIRNIVYATDAGPEEIPWELDVYLPSQAGVRPVVVLLHEFKGLKEGYYIKLSRVIAETGTLVFTVNWPTWIDDLAVKEGGRGFRQMTEAVECALRFATAASPYYGGDPERITLVGHGLGADYGALIAMAGEDLDGLWGELASTQAGPFEQVVCSVPEGPASASAFVGIGGSYDRYDSLKEKVPALWEILSLKAHLSAGSGVQIRLMHGERDSLVGPDHSASFNNLLVKAGYDSRLALFDGTHLVPWKLTSEVILEDQIGASAGQSPSGEPSAQLLVTGLDGRTGAGSAIGPGGALYVTEGAAGRILRVDPQTGEVTTFASGLPKGSTAIGIGGAMDVAFIGSTAYALVTLVGPDVGGSDAVGIYRVDGPDSFTVVADIGEFSTLNPPETQFDVPSGVQYALETFRGGFLVTDGHLNRVLWVTLDGEISELIAFDNTVPTGLDVHGDTIYMAEAGPTPHLPQDGKVVSFGLDPATATEVASGARLNVDVEFGRGRSIYALSQGEWPLGGPPGSPALANTGALLEVNADGSMSVLIDGLNLPTSVEFIGNTAYVISLAGEIWRIDNVSKPPYGISP